VTRFPVVLGEGRSAVVMFPDDITVDEWTLVDQIVRIYVEHAQKRAAQEVNHANPT
jgi:hypothetical protein